MIQLNDNEKSILRKTYGFQFSDFNSFSANKIDDVVELTPYEKRFFDKNNFVSPNFSVQILYKVAGNILPINFNRAIHNLMATDENFRANYFMLGNRMVKVVQGTSRAIPKIIYRNFTQYDGEEIDEMLTKILEADRRLTFDLQSGYLIRCSVFRTKDNESAVLITLPQLIADNFDAKSFFHSVLYKTNYIKVVKLPNLEVSHVEDTVREYWRKILNDLPAVRGVPYSKKFVGVYTEKSYREKIPADIFSDLRAKAQSNKAMLMTILQSAWGFLLQAVDKLNDVAFCRLAANSKSINVIPVRLHSADNETVEDIIKKQFKQMIVSQPYSFFDWDNLKDIANDRNIKFDHFLSFLDFQNTQKIFSESESLTGGNVIVKNYWDSCGMKLGVYFQYSNTNLSVTFQYNANEFIPAVGMKFAELYNLILQQMLVYWNTPFNKFMAVITDKISADTKVVEEIQEQELRKNIIDFISRNKLLRGEIPGTVQMFSEAAKIATYFEGDRISGDILNDNLVFVVEGKLARSLDSGDGWFNALDIISKDGWLNETIFLENRRSEISAEVLTEQAKILLLPISNVDAVMRKYPQVISSFMNHALKQMEKYQLLWLQS